MEPKEKEEGKKDRRGLMENFYGLLNAVYSTDNDFKKWEYIKKVQNFMYVNNSRIQKYIDGLKIEDKIRVLHKIMHIKEEEMNLKGKKEKRYFKSVITISLILISIISALGYAIQNSGVLLLGIVFVSAIAIVLTSLEEYIYDMKSTRREWLSIKSWINELKEEAEMQDKNDQLKFDNDRLQYEKDKLMEENEELKQNNESLVLKLKQATDDLKRYVKNK